jgi:CO dehydrogenase maturation factor
VLVVANKVRDEKDEAFIREKIPAEDLLGIMHYDPEVAEADRLGESPYETAKNTVEEIRVIKNKMEISL